MARVVLPGPPPLEVDLGDLRGPSLEADLAARDVTVDALAVDLDALLGGAAPIRDPTGGLGDLAARRLRACGPTAFADDPLRVLRLLRLGHQPSSGSPSSPRPRRSRARRRPPSRRSPPSACGTS
jgi:hypothetical protein